MNMQPSREALVAQAQALPGQDLLTCALQLMDSALVIVDASPVPSAIGAHLDHAVQMLAEHLVAYPAGTGSAGRG